MEGILNLSERIPDIRKDEVFVLMPYLEELKPTYKSIKKVGKRKGLKVYRADEIHNGIIMNKIIDGILNSEIIIADVTGENFNVFFELGLAQAKRDCDVIIISQTHEKAPFDIRNWQILPYSANNLDAFESDLDKKIDVVRDTFGSEKLFSLLLKASPANKEHIINFLDHAKELDPNHEKLKLICRILADAPNLSLSSQDLEDLNEKINAFADKEDEDFNDIANFIKPIIFSSHIILHNHFSFIQQKFISEWKVDSVTMKELPLRDVSSKICFRIIEMNHPQKKVAVDWLINYLKNKRMGRIDPVRAQIANFLITTKDEIVNDGIRNLLNTNDHSQLEAAIDISGQKKLNGTDERILQILRNAKDPFVARCCAYALPRLGCKCAGKEIYHWMLSNTDKWGKQAVSANLQKDVLNALGKDSEYYELVANFSSG